MTALADRIENASPSSAAVYDLEGLLDHYAEVTIANARCTAVLESNPARTLARSLEAIPESGDSQHRILLRRRLDHLTRCKERSDQLELELATVEELLGYLAQWALLDHPGYEYSDDVVASRLACIDAELAASHILDDRSRLTRGVIGTPGSR